MKVTIHDFENHPHEVNVPDGTTEIAGVVITGDEVLVYPVAADPNEENRIADYLDGFFLRRLVDGKWIDIDPES